MPGPTRPSRTSGKPISDDLRRDLLFYYSDLGKPFATKWNSKEWQELVQGLDLVKWDARGRVAVRRLAIC